MNLLHLFRRLTEDELREERIELYRRAMNRTQINERRMRYWRLMKEEIGRRSSEQVARMEREKGLLH